jgi:ketosteroid isomerase-like protein
MGEKSEVWVRATECYRKINGHWLAVHDHISVPADMETGKAALDLKP